MGCEHDRQLERGVIPEKYFNGDTVNLGDGPSNRTLTLTGITVSPASVNASISAGDYVITGSGSIGGSASLTKSGSSRLTIATDNSYSGGTTISAGTLQLGTGGTAGSLGTGAVINDSNLALGFAGNATVPNAVSGNGTVQQMGSGTVTLSGASTYVGATTIAAGSAIRVTNATALGSSVGSLTGAAVFVVSGGAFDLSGSTAPNALNFGSKQFFIAGTGIGRHWRNR
jgi:fibronectin-binding autotransporter adhesin